MTQPDLSLPVMTKARALMDKWWTQHDCFTLHPDQQDQATEHGKPYPRLPAVGTQCSPTTHTPPMTRSGGETGAAGRGLFPLGLWSLLVGLVMAGMAGCIGGAL